MSGHAAMMIVRAAGNLLRLGGLNSYRPRTGSHRIRRAIRDLASGHLMIEYRLQIPGTTPPGNPPVPPDPDQPLPITEPPKPVPIPRPDEPEPFKDPPPTVN